MEHFFELPINYKGEEISLNGRLVTFAYTYKFYIVAFGKELVFEYDDNGEIRVLSSEANADREADPELLFAIVDVLRRVQAA